MTDKLVRLAESNDKLQGGNEDSDGFLPLTISASLLLTLFVA